MSEVIKTALERALERMMDFKEVSAEEISAMEHRPRGRALGATFLKEADFDIAAALKDFDSGILPYIKGGVEETLLLNIILPGSEEDFNLSRRAMEGIYSIKVESPAAGEILGQMGQLLNQYRQTQAQALENFKRDFDMEARLTMRQNRQRSGAGGETPARLPGFREEWGKVQSSMEAQFLGALKILKDSLREIK